MKYCVRKRNITTEPTTPLLPYLVLDSTSRQTFTLLLVTISFGGKHLSFTVDNKLENSTTTINTSPLNKIQIVILTLKAPQLSSPKK